MIYQISKVCLALMYMQHKHMVYGKLHIYPYLVLDQNSNDNAYSTPLCHEVYKVDHKMIILGIDSCYNKFHILMFNIRIILNMILSVCPYYFHELFLVFCLINDTIFAVIFFRKCWNYLAKIISSFSVPA